MRCSGFGRSSICRRYCMTESRPMSASIWSDLHADAERKNLPRYCQIEVTRRCNFRCRHCYMSSTLPVEASCLPPGAYQRFLRELRQMGGLSVCFTGGEPLLCLERLSQLLGMVRKEGMFAVVFTNGSLVTRQAAHMIRESRVLEVGLTLYGSCAETMDSFTRRPGSFDRSVQGVKWLVEEGNRVNVRWPVTRENLWEFTAMYNLIRGLGAVPSHYVGMNRCWDGSEYPYELEMDEEDFCRYFDTLSQLDIFEDIRADLRNSYASAREKGSGQRAPCGAGRAYMYLASDGLLYPCSHIRRPLGSIVTESLPAIWRNENPVLREIRAATLDRMKCARCEYVMDCGICIAEFHAQTGSFTEPDEHSCRFARLGRRVRDYVTTRYFNGDLQGHCDPGRRA